VRQLVLAMSDALEADPCDAQRYPGLSAQGAAMLRFMREHPHAPIYRKHSGHRLLPTDLPELRRFEGWVRNAPIDNHPHTPPAWMASFLQYVAAQVPAYRALTPPGVHFKQLPTTTRADLSTDIAQFVPDDVPLQRLINFSTSGTSGHPLLIASHPVVAARYRAFHERALARHGIELQAGRGEVGVVLIGWQRQCFTYVSVTPTRDESGLAKINLHPDDWRHAEDRAKYLDALAAEIYAGDPLSFAALLELPTRHRPRALLSTSMTLLPGLRHALEQHFAAPVLDLYSMNEAGPIAVMDPALDAHVLLQPRLYVEILDEQGASVTPGERGEVTLTGGFNFCLPLLRYRTGDYARLQRSGADWLLCELHGRPPVCYRRADSSRFNNVEITHALKHLGLAQWQVHQFADGSVRARVRAAREVGSAPVAAALRTVFGADSLIHVEIHAQLGTGDKLIQYTADV
jgi:phenylacetate-CoA ligase